MVSHRLFVCAIWISCLAMARSVAADGAIDFSRQVLPILSNKCFVCHGPDAKEQDALRLDSLAGATRDLGGYRAIDPQEPAASRLLVRIHSADEPMPPADHDKQLTDAEREILTRWVKEGGEYAKHWAFVKPTKAALPDAAGREIDALIEKQLTQHGVTFADVADRATLARRAAMVLTGLPPTPEQLRTMLNDQAEGAFERYVDRLLASPRYGEHQARYWLDAVRYGDTHGLHLDNRRGIYPYRDWVVHALNANLPLDQFITWQLAGDLLPNATLEQRVATGFVRMNPTTGEGGAIPAEFQAKNNFDRVETLGTVFLGMSLTCARCHTHKYDPIAQSEYYELLAFFNSTAEPSMDGNSYTYGNTMKAPADQAAWGRWQQQVKRRDALLSTAADRVAGDDFPAAARSKWDGAGPQQQLLQLADPAGSFAGTELQTQASTLDAEMKAAEKTFTTTLVAVELPKPRETRLLRRGEYHLPVGDPLQPGVIDVMGALPAEAPRNRLGLAQWLTSAEHPLVARVLVNRIWQRVFGYGLVRTPEDFGLQGEQPTHPELLDWLAVELHESGWDLKHLLRLMVNSRTFQQSSVWRADLDDPENRLFARGPRHRLDAEVIRDLALWSSGLLAEAMGGEGVKPYQPPGMWLALAHPGSNTKKYERDNGARLYRRSLYVYWKRTSPHPMMTLFDAPSRESSCVRRSRTNTSLQSLGLLNETQRVEMARVFAQRLLTQADQDQVRLDLLFTLLACRPASEVERQACMQLLEQLRERYRQAPKDAAALVAIGDAPRDEQLAEDELAAWTQVAITVLASDVALMLY